MKRRKRIGFPKSRPARACGTDEAVQHPVPDDLAELMRDVMEERQLAARQRRALDAAAKDSRVESTPEKLVALLNRMAETEGAFTPPQRGMARKQRV